MIRTNKRASMVSSKYGFSLPEYCDRSATASYIVSNTYSGGHLVPQVFQDEIENKGLDVRPSIAVTKAHIKLSEVDESARKGGIKVDDKIVLKSRPLLNADGSLSDADPGVELVVSKAAVEPVWYLPGVAERFGMYVKIYYHRQHFDDVNYSSESLLRRALFEDTGGMYPELITRPDVRVFLPPIGNLTVYICTLSFLSIG